MMIQQDDPRLTAYALGELSPEQRAEFELLLARDARARSDVAAIAETSARLSRELGGADSPALSERRRASIRAALAPNGAVPPGDRALEQAALENTERDAAALFRPRRLRPRVLGVWLAALVPCAGAVALMLSNSGDSVDGEALGMGDVPQLLLQGKRQAETDQEQYAPAADSQTSLWGEKRPSPRAAREMALHEAQSFGEVGALRAEPLALADPGGGGDDSKGDLGASVALRAVAPARANDMPVAPALRPPAVQAPTDPGVDGFGSLSDFNRESYDVLDENPFIRVSTDPRSTFSIDVDTASYALVRRFLKNGQLPPSGAVRIEELINYFSYRYPQPAGEAPVSVLANVGQAPWAPEHQLVRVALQARHVAANARPPANLVFLIDVSGSMDEPNKLGLVKYGLRRLSESLGAKDRVSIVTYAGNSGLVLAPTPGSQRSQIQQAIAGLEPGGSTNGGSGIELAYSLARKHFVPGNVNRVILATDGDFNVGVTSQSELVELVQRQAKSGVFLSVLGFGDGNYQDSMLEKLADKGNGNYAYIDEPAEAQKVLVEQATGTLLTLAKDVKLQLEFNPAEVAAYRLIGYENRKLAHQDFNDDTKDAGELGADHSVTALYEVIPAGKPVPGASVDALKYQAPAAAPAAPLQTSTFQGELLSIKLRYQPPAGGASQLIEQAVRGPTQALEDDFRFAAAVAEFGMLLRASPHRGKASYDQVLKLAQSSLGAGKDRSAREQFVALVQTARRLAQASDEARPASPAPLLE